jgi:phage terminase large subunit-like protein
VSTLEELKIAPEVAAYMQERGIPLPATPPKWITPSPGECPGAWFDPHRVDVVMRAFQSMRHTQGKWAGTPLRPDPWQVAYILAPVFGWVRYNDDGDVVRVVRKLYADLPRKNGKTTLCGGLAVYMLAADQEAGAQVYAAAVKKDQAQKLFQPVKQLALSSPTLKRHLKAYQGQINHPASGSYFKVEANDPDGLHGANVHCAVVDELHVHKSPDLLKALETGMGSRTQPLSIVITTADNGRVETVYGQRRSLIEQLARRTLTDAAYYGVIWAADETDDPFAEATWAKANPGYPISPNRDFLRNAATEAQNSPADLAEYLRLHLGIRTKQQTRYIEVAEWDASAGPAADPEDLVDQTCFGGLDLAATSDLCALCWVFPQEDGSYIPQWHLWTPEDNLRSLDKRTAGAASVWVRDGYLTLTPGNVADYDWIKAQILSDMETYDIQGLAYDRWNSSQLVNDLTNDGVPLVPMGQGYASMSAPTKELLRLVRMGRFNHGGNPVLRWMVDGFAVVLDPAGNVKPDRAAVAAAGFKMDGLVAAIMAVNECMLAGPMLDPDEFRSL